MHIPYPIIALVLSYCGVTTGLLFMCKHLFNEGKAALDKATASAEKMERRAKVAEGKYTKHEITIKELEEANDGWRKIRDRLKEKIRGKEVLITKLQGDLDTQIKLMDQLGAERNQIVRRIKEINAVIQEPVSC